MFGLILKFIKSDKEDVLTEVGFSIGFILDISNQFSNEDPDSKDNPIYQVISYILSLNIIPDMINALYIDNSEIQRVFLYNLKLISDYGSREDLDKVFDLSILDSILKILNNDNSPKSIILVSLYVIYNLLKVSDRLTDLFNKENTFESLFHLLKNENTEEIRMYVFEIFSQFFNSKKKRIVYEELIEKELFKYLLTELEGNDNKLKVVKLNLIEDLLNYECYNNLDHNNTFFYRIEHNWFEKLSDLQSNQSDEVFRKAERIIIKFFPEK